MNFDNKAKDLVMANARKILLIGANGQLGFELRAALAPLAGVLPLTRQDIDLGAYLTMPRQLQAKFDALVEQYQPVAIVNAAAYTAVDKAESEPELAEFINGQVPAMLARATRAMGANKAQARQGACLVHYSTDYVFDGRHEGYNPEDARTGPRSVYGRTKLQGELGVAQACPRHLIFRTSWVLGPHGGNFLKTMLRLGSEREQLRVVGDQFGAPTSASLIAKVTAHVLKIMIGRAADDKRWGTYHLVADGETSWYQYAQYVLGRAHRAGMTLKVSPEAIQPIKTSDFPTAAIRPLNSRLSTNKLQKNFGIVLPDWRQGVDDVLDQVLGDALNQKQSDAIKRKGALNTMPT